MINQKITILFHKIFCIYSLSGTYIGGDEILSKKSTNMTKLNREMNRHMSKKALI